GRRGGGGGEVGGVRGVEADDWAGLGDAVQLGHEGEHVRDVLDDLVADDQVELVVGEGVGHAVEVVEDVRLRARVAVQADCARRLVPAAPDVENLHAPLGPTPFGLRTVRRGV